jgi:hypothetical protein
MVGGGLNLGTAHVARAEKHLALQVCKVDHIEIHQSDASDASGGEIKPERAPETARADAEHLGLLELELPFHADFRHDEVAAIAQDFFF